MKVNALFEDTCTWYLALMKVQPTAKVAQVSSYLLCLGYYSSVMKTHTFLFVATFTLFIAHFCHSLPVEPIHGLVAAVFTPFDHNGSVAIDVIDVYAQWLNQSGVFVVFVSGTTGESLDLTSEERRRIAEAWADSGPRHGIRVIVHVGAESVLTAQSLAAHAASLKGVYAISAMPPVFFKPGSVQALVDTMGSIAAAAPSLPFYYYHIPQKTEVNFNMRDFLSAADGAIPNLVGIKFTHTAFDDLQYCLRFRFKDGSFPDILFGKDEMLLAALALGVKGAVGTTYNYNGILQNTLVTAFNKGDMVTAHNAQFDTTTLIVSTLDFSSSSPEFGFKVLMNVVMEAMKLPNMGLARLPFIRATPAQYLAFSQQITKWCLTAAVGASWCSQLSYRTAVA
jgi:N-acetylneuraminate lyase